MKKLVFSLLIVLIPTPALANCPSGRCAVEINVTTGKVTYTDAPPVVQSLGFTEMHPVAPTHTINVQTNNQGWSASGTPEQIAQSVETLAPKPLTLDPCRNGGCTKVEVNATTGITTITSLSEGDLKQRAKDQVEQSQRQAELAKKATQALPNITLWQPSDPLNKEPIIETELDETLTPEWWNEWLASFDLFFKDWFWWWSL